MRFTRHLLAVLCITAAAVPAWAEEKSDLHLKASRRVAGTHHMNAKGYTWDIRTDYGSAYHATNYLYSNGLHLYVDGNNFHSSQPGRLSADGNELETGPWNRGSIRVHRRIKIFKEDGVGRWLDIYTNTSGSDQTITVRVQSHINYGIQQLHTSSGNTAWDEKDFAAVIDVQRRNNTPSALHVVCGPRSKLRPTLNRNGNVLQFDYRLTVPAGETAIIAHFVVQDHSTDDLRSMIKKFKPQAYLGDLKTKVRKMIVNVAESGFDMVDLDRSAKDDMVLLRSGDPIFGKITNEKFVIHSAFGPLEMPADRVIGMAANPHVPGVYHAVLADGQLICGTLNEQVLTLEVPAAGQQKIPFEDIEQWSYQINSKRPEEIPFNGPLLLMRTGDRLAFKTDSVAFKLRTRSGVVDLDGEALLSIDLDNPAQTLHRVRFDNGSVMAGVLEPASFEVELRLNAQRTIERNAVRRIIYAMEESRDRPLTRVDLDNGDQLYGRLTEEALELDGKYGPVSVKPTNVLTLQTTPARPGWVRLTMWNGSVLQGRLNQETVKFTIEPGPTLDVDVAHIVGLARPNALPPEAVRKKVDALVGRLAAESFKDRKQAQQELIDMGPSILPLLKDRPGSSDPEVKRRLEEIREALSPSSSAVTGPANQPFLQLR